MGTKPGGNATAGTDRRDAATGEPYQRVTAAMVAERAGVSTATVSLVANGKTEGRVSAENAAKVRAAITELNYVVDRVASSLSTGFSNFIILVAPDISNPFYARLIDGVRESLGAGYHLLLSVTAAGQMPEAGDVRELLAFRPAGLLVDAPSPRFLADLAPGRPMVLLDAPGVQGTDARAPAVNLDVVAGAEALAVHLAERGHRTVAYLDSVTATSTFELRRAAFLAKAAELSLAETAPAASTIEVGAAAAAFRAAWPGWAAAGVTAVVCSTDTHAYGVLQEARILGLRVPEDLAVSGFDNLPYSALSDPSLTSVELPAQELGRAAAARLLELIQGRGSAPEPVTLPSRLIIRESTGGN